MKFSILLPLIALTGSSLAAAVPEAAPFEFTITPAPLTAERFQELETGASNSTLVARQGSCTFQAFSGSTCNYPAGGIITNPNECVDTRNRHSFFVSSGCGQGLRVSVSGNTGCPGGNNGGIAGAGCYNVNTGGNWQSSYVARV